MAGPPVDWEDHRILPIGAAAVLSSLRLHGSPGESVLKELDSGKWERTLSFCDRAQLTLLLGATRRELLPPAIAARIDKSRQQSDERNRRLMGELLGIAKRLSARDVEYLLLKGFAHDFAWAPDPGVRPQYDVDLFAPKESLETARQEILALGFEPVSGLEGFPTDHLPVMVRKTGWQWRGDFYDPGIPPSVDLHFRFWDETTERIAAPGSEKFWERRVSKSIGGTDVSVLCPADDLGYCALHLVRHLLRGDLRPYHVFEIAWFLDRHAADAPLWESWRDTHPAELRRIEALAFELARRWFGCRVAPCVEEEVAGLSEKVHHWMTRFAASPVEGMFRPNKSELWLHLPLLQSAVDRLSILRRRLLPLRPPGPVDAVFVPDHQITLAMRLKWGGRYLSHTAGRAVHHVRALAPAMTEGLGWAMERAGLRQGFLALLASANLYNLGIFIFFLLYNLYLLDLGFGEDTLGQVTGAMTIGTIAGSLPAATLVHRFGLRAGLSTGCVAAALLSATRVLVVSKPALLAGAFVGGLAASIWFVSMTAAVARLSGEKKRPLGFSLWIGTGIATGILGGLIGGWLPGKLIGLGLALTTVSAKSGAVLTGCAVTLLALAPLTRLRLAEATVTEPKTYPTSPPVIRYLAVFAVWQLAIGSFNPFFNAYFSSRLAMPLEQIGVLFAGSQFAQAAGVLLMPLLLRKAGTAAGVSGLQAATAMMLLTLALGPIAPWAATAYIVYMSCQVMTEPGLFSALMNKVRPFEQSGASGLLFFVISASHAVAAVAAGYVVAKAGYSPVLAAAALLAIVSAVLFRKVAP